MTTVSVELPEVVAAALGRDARSVARAVLESVAVDLYRSGRISYLQLCQTLTLSRDQADGLLKRHHVTEDLLTAAEFDQQVAADLDVHRAP